MDKKVLLIADDDEMNRRVIRRFLKSSYDVVEAQNGREALECLGSMHVDAMLLDIIMPELDGLEVLKQVKKDSSYEQIGILVATSTKEKTERTALSLGADDIVSKPYDPIVIQKRLENILAMKEIYHQRKMLQNEAWEALYQEQLDTIRMQAGELIRRICKYADIIGENRDNEKLVGEITEEIKETAVEIQAIISKEEV